MLSAPEVVANSPVLHCRHPQGEPFNSPKAQGKGPLWVESGQFRSLNGG